MRMTYDPAADAMYLYLAERVAEGPKVTRTEEVAPGLMLNFDNDGRSGSKCSRFRSSQAPNRHMAFEVLTSSDAAEAAE